MEAVMVEERARVLVGGSGRSKEGERIDVQLTFLALGGMTMTGVIAWMKVAEQWRAWVFLLLNLLLLAILLSSSKKGDDSSKNATTADIKEPKRITVSAVAPKCDASDDEAETEGSQKQVGSKAEEEWEEDAADGDGRGCFDGHGEEDEDDELNERVEAFIVMFRQHLVADAKSTRIAQHGRQYSTCPLSDRH